MCARLVRSIFQVRSNNIVTVEIAGADDIFESDESLLNFSDSISTIKIEPSNEQKTNQKNSKLEMIR